MTIWARRAQQKAELCRGITWTSHEPIEFLLRRGDHFDNEPDIYERMYAPENLKRMKAAGVRYGRLFFYKGLGIQAERANMDRSIEAARQMHELGMKVALYIGGTMFTETFYRETPAARSWEQRDQNDHWVSYGSQTFRHMACPHEPAYRDYIKRVLKIGIEECRADEVSFDNIFLSPEPKSCRCPRCQSAFHEFLRRRYPTRAEAHRRFGVSNTDWLNVNEWDGSATPDRLSDLKDPVLQEWVRFRCESLANYAGDLSSYAKKLNPNVVVHLNMKGVYCYNRYWTNAVYHPLFNGYVDVVSFDTGGYDARIDRKTGALVSQIRSYKVARRLRASCEERLDDELRTAVHMAFGYPSEVAGYPGAPWIAGALNVNTPMMEFFREYHDRYCRETELVADVAVLRNWPSMAHSISANYIPATLVEQVLIQYKVPFDLIFEEQLSSADRYAAIMMAGQDSISDAQAEFLLKYVRQGGVLILAGDIGIYNQWRELRHANPLLPARTEGKGRIVHVSRIIPGVRRVADGAAEQDPEPGATGRKGVQMATSDWVLPRNHEEIYRAVAGSLPNGLSATSDAPLTTVMELLTRPKARQTMLHFVNFDRAKSTSPFAVTLRKQFSGPVRTVQCFSPERDTPESLKFQETGGRISFTVPMMRLYAMIVVS